MNARRKLLQALITTGAGMALVPVLPAAAQGSDLWAYLSGRKWKGQAKWSDASVEGGQSNAWLAMAFGFAGPQGRIEGQLELQFNFDGRDYYATYNIRGYCDRTAQALVIDDGGIYRADMISGRNWAERLTGTLRIGRAKTFPGHYAFAGTLWEPTHSLGFNVQLIDMDSFTDPFPPRA